MNDNKSLNNKYQSFEAEELVIDEPSKPKKPKKEKVKKEKAPKPPKEKKVKEPKPPKEKKAKEPKPPKEKKVKEPKPPKEKKVKEPKLPKEKKEKKPLFSKKVEKAEPELEIEFESEVAETPEIPQKRRTEEVVLPVIKSVTKISESEEGLKTEKKKKTKEKKIKEPKVPKEKKEKAPKPPKEKKVKEPKPPKEKKAKEPKPPKEKKPREPLTIKDFLTIAIAVVAVAMIAVVVGFKYFPGDEPNVDNPESTTTAESQDKLGDIQIVRDGINQNIVQSDIPDVFYGFTSDYKLQYYQYHDSKMTAVKSTGTLTTSVDMGNEDLPVTIEYVQMADKIFGIGLFRADQHQDVYFYNLMVFKLVNLPVGYEQEGKALLLATENNNALSQNDILWSESFIVDLATGKTERFLKIINRTIDMSGAGVDDFCILTNAGYNSTSGRIPFITSRTYGLDSGKQDIFIKNGAKEELLVSDVYGKFFLTDGNDIIYMRKTNTGFDIIRRSGETETIVKSCYGAMSTDYLLTENYILNKDDGKLYNLLTGEEKLIVGYRMSAEQIKISPDGKYLIMMGTVKNMLDYQIHIFNLETGDYAKYVDKNYSSHSNLAFINNTTAVYVVVDPNQGYECVVLDVAKAV